MADNTKGTTRSRVDESAPAARSGETLRAKRDEMRALLGRGADSQLGVAPGEAPTGVVPTEQPEGVAMNIVHNRNPRPDHERRSIRRDADDRHSATHITDPADGSSMFGAASGQSTAAAGSTAVGRTSAPGTVSGSSTGTGTVSRAGTTTGGAASGIAGASSAPSVSGDVD